MDTLGCVPAGFHFTPTEEELIEYYLRKKVMGEALPCENAVIERDLYGASPWKLLKVDDPWIHVNTTTAGKKNQDNVIYVFTQLKKMCKNKIARTAGCGTWDGQTGRTKVLNSQKQVIGYKKMFVFQVIKGSAGEADLNDDHHPWSRSHWIMHEYSIAEEYVVCKIRRDDSKGLKLVGQVQTTTIPVQHPYPYPSPSLPSSSSSSSSFHKRKSPLPADGDVDENQISSMVIQKKMHTYWDGDATATQSFGGQVVFSAASTSTTHHCIDIDDEDGNNHEIQNLLNNTDPPTEACIDAISEGIDPCFPSSTATQSFGGQVIFTATSALPLPSTSTTHHCINIDDEGEGEDDNEIQNLLNNTDPPAETCIDAICEGTDPCFPSSTATSVPEPVSNLQLPIREDEAFDLDYFFMNDVTY